MTEFYVISGKTYLTLLGMIKELSTGLDEAPAFPAPREMIKATFDLEEAKGREERLKASALKAMAERDALREELSLAYAQVDKLRAMESEANHRAKTAEVRLKKMAPLIEAAKAYALSPTDSAAETAAVDSLEWAALDLFAKEARKP